MFEATLQDALRLQKAGDLAASEQLCRQVLEHDARSVSALHLLGLACRKAEKLDDALTAFQEAAALQPRNPLYCFELGLTHSQRGELEQAYGAYRRAIALKPDFQEAYVNGGAMLNDLGRHEEAIPWYQKSLQLNPNCSGTYLNLGNVYQELARFDLAVQCYSRAIELDPANARAHWNRGMANLRSGNFKDGWEGYEWRVPSGETKLDVYPYPAWDGSSLAGKTLLVHGEQGIGDEILFASCFPDLVEQAGHCIFVCEPRLATLFARSFPQATVIGHRRKKENLAEIAQHVDFSIAAGSVPRFLRTSMESFPNRNSFLTADPKRVALWRERFAALGPGLKIGISWRAGGKPSEHLKRTTDLRLWRGVFAVPGTHFVNLQYGQCEEEIAYARESLGVTIHDWPDADALTDLDGLAAQMCALDLVIAVVNTTVHLAGALGVPAWGLLPGTPSWRWMDKVDRVPWYSSVRLIRQERGQSWKPVFDRVRTDLCRQLGVEDSSLDVVWEGDEVCNGAAIGPQATMAATHAPGHMTATSFGTKVNELIEQAVEVHRNGDLDRAEKLYRDVLNHAPQHADALHLLGVIHQQRGRPQQAIKLIQQAIRMVDTLPNFHYHLGLAQKDLGCLNEAMASYRRAVELNPQFVEPQLNLGVALQTLGQLDEAIGWYQKALAIKPDSPGLHYNLGGAYWKKGRVADSLANFETALRLQPLFPEALVQIGQIRRELGKPEEALECYRKAIEQNPACSSAHGCLGRIYHDQQRYDEAILAYQQALAIKPRCFETLANLGSAFHEQGEFRLAEDCYCRALALQSDNKVRLNLASALRHTGQLDTALGIVGKVLAHDPKNVEAHLARAMLWLQQGNFSQGWDEFEWRRGVPHRMRAREIAAPEWDGSSLAGKTLLVHGEGNLDEEILFASCLGDVIQSSGKCRIACDPRLVPLFEQSFPMANIEPLDPKPASTWRPQAIRDESRLQIPRRKGQRAELVSVDESNRSELQDGIDFHVPLGSLPRHTRRTAESFPQAAGFLHARPNRLQFWREKLATLGDGPRIGLAWRSTAPAAPASSYPAWDHWSALVAAPGVQFVSLHGGDFRSDVELAASVWGAQIHVPVACSSLDDLAETAALISSLDLVIAVDNVFAHLAGALGAACWTVLPPAWGWVWGLGDRTPWYGSMRLFRAPRASAWPSLFEQLAAALAQFTQERRQVAMSIDVRSDAPHDGARRRKRDALTITSTQD